ncbi:GNAT family N-acetyltransferase [Microbacterium lushaniae]|nr:GNAT family N-acetyltransferase [Microbacterium lushaniae]KAA9159112.1 GNAT family N-acetyltransferase [Microbacterium lushaniae]
MSTIGAQEPPEVGMTALHRYLVVRELLERDADHAAELLGVGMSDNPIHRAVYGERRRTRERRHTAIMRTMLSRRHGLRMEGAFSGDDLVAVTGWTPPGRCRPTAGERAWLALTALRMGPRVLSRLVAWQSGWAAHDLDEAHVHLGPVAVDAGMRRQGLGTLLLLRHTAALDAVGAVGYLETDRPEAVPFYTGFGYVVVAEEKVLGVPCWFLRRPASH